MKWKQNLEVRLAGALIAAVLGCCTIAFLAFAAYLALLDSPALTPLQAALVAALGCLLLALLVWLCVRWVVRRRPGTRHRSENPRDRLEEALQPYADPALKSWVRQYPDRAAIMSVLLGVAAGYSPAVRRLLHDLYDELAHKSGKDESARRH